MKKGSGIIKFLVLSAIAVFFLSNPSSKPKTSTPSTTPPKSYSSTTLPTNSIKKISYTCGDGTTYESYSEYQDCQNRYNWRITRDIKLAECNADSSKFNCRYDDYPGTTLYWDYYTYSSDYNYQAPSSNGVRYGAICRDGTQSSATGRGACSHHGGVSMWLTY